MSALKALGASAAVAIVAVVVWATYQNRAAVTTALPAVETPQSQGERTRVIPRASKDVRQPALASAAPRLRDQYREAKDYAQFVRDIRTKAGNGDPEAQYLTAQALRYCANTTGLYFRPIAGKVPTLEEVQARRAKHSQGISLEELSDIYSRCHGFIAQPELFSDFGSWKQWLDKAVDGGSAAAMALKATVMDSDAMISSLSELPHAPVEADTRTRAQDFAVDAVQSGDPDAIFSMAAFVRAGNRLPEENAALISAWELLACQKGYDCSQNSNWMRSVCASDVQCANDQTYTDYFKRNLGTQYSDVLNLAQALNQAIRSKDVQSIRSYL